MPPATPSSAPPPLGSSSPIAMTVQLPSLPQEPYILHPLLELSPSPAIQWDVRTSPLTIQMAYHSSRSQTQRRSAAWTPNACFARWWHEPATSPPVQSLTIRVEGCQENIIFVHPGHSGTQFVTILDVVSCVYGAPRCAFGARDCSCCSRYTSVGWSEGHDETPMPPQFAQSSLLFALESDAHSRDANMYTQEGRRFRRPESLQRDDGVVRWRWRGLSASTLERDVWTLYLA